MGGRRKGLPPMTIPFKTQLCNFTKDGKPCYQGRTQPAARTSEDTVYARAAIRCGGVDPAFVKCAVQTYFGEIGSEFQQGFGFEGEFFSGGVSVRGLFGSADAPWNPKVNTLATYLTPRGKLKEAVRGLTATNVTSGPRVSVRSAIQDATGAVEGIFVETPDMTELLVLLAGTGLLVDVEAPDEGVSLLDPKTGEVKSLGRVTNATSTTLDCSFDPVEPGQYVLAVASRNGMGASYGVALGKRKVTVVRAIAEG